MNLLLGIGNPDRGDDGIGSYLAQRFVAPGWSTIDCGVTPENYTGPIRQCRPDVLILVDAARMGLAPGTLRRIGPDQIGDLGLGTHRLSLQHMLAYLRDTVGLTTLIGIQPERCGFGDPLSPAALRAADELEASLRTDQWRRIPPLHREQHG
jgi:hydrogenase 3 maturation protease